jgi:4-amino-4-deoxy-L-arabinose transferase-like glycosyltransferase
MTIEPAIPIRTRLSLLAAILLLAAALRFTGLNWDEGQWIHPDEGHMRMITASIHWPADPSLYFDALRSPLNSFNKGQSYSYGTLPLFLVRLAAEGLDRGCGESPNRIMAAVAGLIAPDAMPCWPGLFTTSLSSVVGRALSALADLGSVWLVYLIGRRLYGDKAGLLAALFAALTASAIQQAHFYTVDSLASFFTVLTVYYSVRVAQADAAGGPPWTLLALAGLAVGLATACKLSAALSALFVALAGAAWAWRALGTPSSQALLRRLVLLSAALGLAALMSLVAFRVAQPYAFEGPGFFGLKPYQPWWERMGQIQAEQSGSLDAPPGQQWTNRAPIWFPWLNIVVWGMGLPLGLAAWAGWAVAGINLARGRRQHFVLWLGLTLLFLYLSTRWVKTMRYFLPLYPLLAILAAYGLSRLWQAASLRTRRLGLALTIVVVAGAVLWAAAMFGIYLRPATRVAASRWVYDHVPAGSILANEHWDWGLPLPVDGQNPFNGLYAGFEMANYDADTPEKRAQLYNWLDRADYISLASNRLYASISRLPERYPLTTAYYRALFAGDLGFELVADYTSYPAIGPFRFPDQEIPYPLQPAAYTAQSQWQLPLPPAEEAFSVYDHPRVLIFRKTEVYSPERVEAVLGSIDLSQARLSLTPQQATTPIFHLEWAWFLGGLATLALAGLGVTLLSCRSSHRVL